MGKEQVTLELYRVARLPTEVWWEVKAERGSALTLTPHLVA